MRLIRFIYNGIPLNLSIPPGVWVPGRRAAGAGTEESASGMISGWVTRRDRTLRVPIRFTEQEWPQVRAFLDAVDTGAPFTFRPDISLPATHTVVLVEPRVDDDIEPAPIDPPGTYQMDLVLRSPTGAPLDIPFFNE